MGISQEQLDSFHQFASEKVNNGGSELTMPDLVQLWANEHHKMEQDSNARSNGTPLGAELLSIRKRYIEAGGELSSADDINVEVATGSGER